MKYRPLIYALSLLAMQAAVTGCSDDDTVENVRYSQMVILRSQTLTDGQTVNPSNPPEVTLSFNNLVSTTSTAINLNGEPTEATTKGMDLVITLPRLDSFSEYTLEIPAGAVAIADKPEATNDSVIIIRFNTNFGVNPSNVDKAPVNPNASQEVKELYAYLRENYTKTMLSGAMGGVGWELEYTDLIASETGKYPAVVGFDYLHLASSPSNWIDYGDITPVKKVHDAGSIVQIQWHWNVPVSNGEEETPENPDTPDTPETTTGVKAVLWEGEKVMPADWSGSVQLADAASLAIYETAEIGDIIEVETKDVASNAQGSFKTMNSSWGEIGSGTEYFEISGDFSLTIDEGILSNLRSTGLIVSGHDYTATRVVLKGKTTAKAPSADVELSFNAQGNNFNPANMLIEGTWENEVATADIAKLAGYLQLLRDAHIPVLWRPFHEAAGDYTWGAWFWWGSQGVEVTKQLYIYLYDQLTNVYGLDNLIWVWTVQTTDAGRAASVDKMRAAYPGDEYVDIVGTDIYPTTSMTDQTDQFNLVNSVVDSRKLVALTECGNLVDPALSAASGGLWSYFMQWYDLDGSYGHTNYEGAPWLTVVESPYVVSAPVNIK